MALNFGQNLFPASPQQQLTSYNFIDTLSQTGYVNFYGGRVEDVSGGVKYLLQPERFYSSKVVSGADFVLGTNYTQFFSGAFIANFILPQQIGGKTVINIPTGAESLAGATNPGKATAVITLEKIDSANNVTTLIQRVSGAEVLSPLGSYAERMSAFKVDIPKTVIAANDSLSLNVELFGRSGGGDWAKGYLGHDPENRSQSGANANEHWRGEGDSVLLFQVPFRINI